MKNQQHKARIEELEQILDIERAAYEQLSRDYDRLVQEIIAAKAELERLRAELDQATPRPRRRPIAA